MDSLVSDFQKRQWKKYNGHCYYYGNDKRTWFLAEQSCKQIGGNLAKIEDAAENKWIKDNRSEQDHYWIGLTDLKEGAWRWSYDQTLATYKPWHSGYGSKGTGYNCGLIYHVSSYTWLDEPCTSKLRYVCESHFSNFDNTKNPYFHASTEVLATGLVIPSGTYCPPAEASTQWLLECEVKLA